MKWFGDNRQLKVELPPLAPPVDRIDAALARVKELKTALELLDAEMLAFKTKNKITADRFGRLLGCHCATITGKAAIETEWRTLLKKRDGLASAWHAALFAWSELKGAAK